MRHGDPEARPYPVRVDPGIDLMTDCLAQPNRFQRTPLYEILERIIEGQLPTGAPLSEEAFGGGACRATAQPWSRHR